MYAHTMTLAFRAGEAPTTPFLKPEAYRGVARAVRERPLHLFETVLAVHAGAFVYVGFGDVGAAPGGYAVFYALADEAAHEEGAAFYPAVGFGIPGDLSGLGHARAPRVGCSRIISWPPGRWPPYLVLRARPGWPRRSGPRRPWRWAFRGRGFRRYRGRGRCPCGRAWRRSW